MLIKEEKCRSCSECRGQLHHWMEPDINGDGDVVVPCKHCDLEVTACQGCYGPIYPDVGGAHCALCRQFGPEL